MTWWEGVIWIGFYFLSMWCSRLLFLLLFLKIVTSLIDQSKQNLKETLKGFKKEGEEK